ncbi:hypothetical protein NQ117_13250 [Paenibacillus sp. SC116]|uniref:hypothetical protein n=1 Tax=Paenibacillus sp. SC116 TaxID=2968986 RepID=UPI00215A1DDC|nr:hypothetical protein [Paenibacillus sp. SC116]MCR8844650.1 hypothetical protein [Paenibacillus sp. SC116]
MSLKSKLAIYATSFALLTTLHSTAYATSTVSIELPNEVLEKVKQAENEQVFTIPEIKAWETDLDGVTREVEPLHLSGSENSTLAPPVGNGYNYVFSHYDQSRMSKDWKYKSIGTYKISNKYSTPLQASYTQTTTATSNWNVSANIAGEATIGNSFLGKIEVTAGASVSKQWTYHSGATYGITQTIPANSVAYISAYSVGYNSGGTLVWNKYDIDYMTHLGTYKESASGTAISKNDVSVEISSTQPI